MTFGYLPYEPPGATGRRPAVIALYRAFSASTSLMCLGATLFAWSMWPLPDETGDAKIVLVLVGFAFAVGTVLYGLGAVVPFQPWGWSLGLLLICLGLPTAAIFVAIPLLVFWLRPHTKAAFMLV